MDNIELPSPDEGPDCKTHLPSSEVKSNEVSMDNIELPSPDEGPDCKTHLPSSEVKSNDVTMDNIELPSPGKGPKCQNQPDSRWAEAFTKLNEGDGQRQINGLLFSKQCKIATGSNGAQVFVGKISDQYVAVKRINTDFVQSELEFFDAVKDLQMSHVLKYICYRQDDDFTYFASQLCEYNLKELIEDKSCPFRDRLVPTFYRRVELCIQFLTGLKELHSADILHRDIKPENVLIEFIDDDDDDAGDDDDDDDKDDEDGDVGGGNEEKKGDGHNEYGSIDTVTGLCCTQPHLALTSASAVTENATSSITSTSLTSSVVTDSAEFDDNSTEQPQKLNQRQSPERKLRDWSSAENKAIYDHFDVNLKTLKCPGRDEILCCIKKYPILRRRQWRQIKSQVWNKIKQLKNMKLT
ncbi:uncharacterized protein [Ptychodera flava]|uniref:uncharacterized protein n=1 Tax=Ptychodera flava TaxID=63121 RepID=UPI003969C87A